MSSKTTLQPGTYLLLTEGAHGDYQEVAIVIVKRQFCAAKAMVAFEASHPDCATKEFAQWLAEMGWVSLLRYTEWWLGHSGRLTDEVALREVGPDEGAKT